MRNRSRPVLHLPRTPLETLLEVLVAIGIIAIIAITVWGWLTLPVSIITHYGLSDTPNAYGGKESLLIVPIIAVCVAVLLTFLSRYPHLSNYPWPITAENAPRQYSLTRLLQLWIAFEMVWILCGMEWILIQAAQGSPPNSLLLLIPAMLLTFIVTIILYYRAAVRAR
jgi:Protein of unknown function (DUF1648)